MIKLGGLIDLKVINEGTKSHVGIIEPNGRIGSTYVHYDGYPQNMKGAIKHHFKNAKDVKDFIKNINFYESDLFFIKSNNTRHNIFGLWSINLLDKLEKDLNNGERKVELWANNTGVKIINMEFSNNDPFFNINTKEDLKKAEEILKND